MGSESVARLVARTHGAQAHEPRLARTPSLFHLLATFQDAINPALSLNAPHPAPLFKHSLTWTHAPHVSHRFLVLCLMRLTASACHTMCPSSSISLVLLLLGLLYCRPTSSEVIQVQIIHRHGARPPLGKSPTDTSKESRPNTLYPKGFDQIENLGKYVRETYISNTSGSRIVDIADTPTGRDIIARTSNLYRTILSSRAFLDNVYPDANLVPRVFEDERNDWMLRGYALCPALDERFAEFRDSEDFKNKQKEKPEGTSETNEDFVIRIAKKFNDYKDDDEKASFFNVWAVYDRYLIIHNDGYGLEKWTDDSPELQGVNKLSGEELARLRDLADWHETRKYDFGAHNIHIAGGLLREIMRRARRMLGGKNSKRPNHRIIEYSAHYPTLLTLFGSLRDKNSGRNEFPANKIPGFGAAIIFELHKDDGKGPVMKLKWWEGYSEGNDDDEVKFTHFAIGRKPCTEDDEGCTFSDMERLVALDDLGEKSFCEDCASSANVCKVAVSQAQCTTGTKVASGFIGAVAGLVVGVSLALFYITLTARRKRNQMVIPEQEFAAEGDFFG